jgi:hypothetical protein
MFLCFLPFLFILLVVMVVSSQSAIHDFAFRCAI